MKKTIHCIALILFISTAVALCGSEVKISSPTHGQHFEECANITLTANINISEEADRVIFYQNGLTLKSVRTAPFEYEWENVPAGIYEITAKLRDKQRTDYLSDPITIIVGDLEQGDMAINGEFSCTSFPWTVSTANGGSANFTIEPDSWLSEGSYASVEVLAPGENPWDVMIYQPCSIIAGHEYELTFSVDALEKGEMIISVQTDGGDWLAHIYQTIAIDGPTTYGPISLVLDQDIPKAQLRLMVGANPENIYFFDNVKYIDKTWEMPSHVEAQNNHSVAQFHLGQNYPNPFNPTTRINYSIERPCHVELAVFNIQGIQVAELIREKQSQGSYEISFDASHLPSGVYYYQLITNDQVLTQKMTLLK